jgi:hypothetical protein
LHDLGEATSTLQQENEMATIAKQIPGPRQSVRRSSWLGRLLRDERGGVDELLEKGGWYIAVVVLVGGGMALITKAIETKAGTVSTEGAALLQAAETTGLPNP